jgi:hypothetical protein
LNDFIKEALDFIDSGGVAQGIGQAFQQSKRDFYHLDR